MIDSKRHTRREATSMLRAALRSWAEADRVLRSGPKTLLMHLVHHANEEAETYVSSKHFQWLMNVSPRTVTNYLRLLEGGNYIALTPNYMIIPSARLPYYRLAPGVPHIESMLDGSESTSAAPAHQSGNAQQRCSNLGRQLGNSRSAYKKNSSDSKDSNSCTGAARYGGPEQLKWIDTFGGEPAMEALPLEVLEAFEDIQDEAWRKSYLAPCRWRQSDRILRARFPHAAKQLIHHAGSLLKAHDISVLSEGRDDQR